MWGHAGKKPCGGGGGDWSDVTLIASQGAPGPPEAGSGGKEPPLGPSEGAQPCDTLISDFRPPAPGGKPFLWLEAPSVALCFGSPEKLTRGWGTGTSVCLTPQGKPAVAETCWTHCGVETPWEPAARRGGQESRWPRHSTGKVVTPGAVSLAVSPCCSEGVPALWRRGPRD